MPGTTKQVSTFGEVQLGGNDTGPSSTPHGKQTAYSYLHSSDSEDADGVRQVRVVHNGSWPQRARVLLEGVPATGVIDSGADITIMGEDLLKRVAAAARLKKSRLKKADKVPRTYDRKPFSLDGRMDLDITFDGVTMQTPVYIKLDASEQLLLSEGVCRQLKILTYHPDVARWINRRDECGDSEVRESASTTLEQGRTGDGRTEEKNEQSKQSTTTRQF